ncbi:MAG: hypothetical protein ACJ77A_16040 [Actinomycetota bacterium]
MGRFGRVPGQASLPLRLAVIGAVVVVAGGGAFAVVKATGSKHAAAPATSPPPTTIRTGAAPSSAAPSASASPSASPSPSPDTTSSPTTASPTPSASTPAATGVAGTWNGTWNSSRVPASGTFQMRFTVQDGILSGAIKVNGTTCISKGSVAGAASGDRVAFGAIKGGVASIAFSGTVTGDDMSGRYDAQGCGGDAGTWKATRTVT